MSATDHSGRGDRPIGRLLSGMAHTLESDRNAGTRVRHVLEQLKLLVPFDHCALLAVAVDGGDRLTVVSAAGSDEAEEQLRPVLERLWILLRKEEQTEQEEHTLEDATIWGGPTGPGPWTSRLAVPLVGLDEVIGVLAVGQDEPDAYHEQDLHLLSGVAALIASYLTALRARRQEHALEQVARGYAEEEKRRLEIFLAMLSHELRNPLAPIRSAVQLLRVQEEDDASRDDGDPSREDGRVVRRKALGAIERQVGTLTRLVDDLLDLSRVTTGRIQLQRNAIELNALVDQAIDAVSPLFAERRQELSRSPAPSALWVHGDSTRLDQILVNLLSNASKFTPERGRIWIEVGEEAGEAVLRIRDAGIGIPADLLPDIFEIFTQGTASPDRTQAGLGLGLALVKGLVEMHGGTVTATSEGSGRGSEFVVRLPVIPSPVPGPAPTAPDPSEASTQTLRVLLVDDLPDATAMFGMLLSEFGYQVRTARDGPGALEAAREFRPDVALLDIGLPGMDGHEVARRMRASPDLRDVVLVAMTGHGSEADRQRSREAGFDHHLVKPVEFIPTVEELLQAIAKEKAR